MNQQLSSNNKERNLVLTRFDPFGIFQRELAVTVIDQTWRIKNDSTIEQCTVAKRGRPKKPARSFPKIEEVTTDSVGTAQAAYWLNRQPQTLLSWSSLENGPLVPIRINDRLHWSVEEIKRLLSGGKKIGAIKRRR